ncbi:HECT-domain (ubiquitin-transferase) domain-containing protein [Cardiosporidium cionae]|uniref:HECT-domain (Ubiquitin-transferase) domain-containing protein n=1 Tax=Cardiosporidium cionae TaxID=476202 RepID=A0ABQ7J8V6_9APIC|nr:HECT-domain (ubiquitin-transferase) domain-containing protein [Cardiosporidium cionae]|eukprot:KAF8820430.1 HECT-domain (ubiquitin-transferase) domain-containing protein [Cardiosporidium cionae]
MSSISAIFTRANISHEARAFRRYTLKVPAIFCREWDHVSKRKFSVSGSYGYSIFGGNRHQETNTRLVSLPKPATKPVLKWESTRWPGAVHNLGAPYFSRKTLPVPITYHRMLLEDENKKVKEDICLLGSANSRLIHAKSIENHLYASTRGFASQIILHGRGVKAYFEPVWPHLFIRLGVGSKPMDVTSVALRFPNEVRLYVDKSGNLLTVHGTDKCKVGNITARLLQIVKANPYTMKGGHLAFQPIRQKFTRKK